MRHRVRPSTGTTTPGRTNQQSILPPTSSQEQALVEDPSKPQVRLMYASRQGWVDLHAAMTEVRGAPEVQTSIS